MSFVSNWFKNFRCTWQTALHRKRQPNQSFCQLQLECLENRDLLTGITMIESYYGQVSILIDGGQYADTATVWVDNRGTTNQVDDQLVIDLKVSLSSTGDVFNVYQSRLN